MSTLLILDFDRTLFDLKTFLQDMQTTVWDEMPQDDAQLGKNNKTLDIFLHPENYTREMHQRLWLAPEFMPRTDYVFEGTSEYLASLSDNVTKVVVTHGMSRHKQYFKRWFAPSIHVLPFYITDNNKGILLAHSLRRRGDSIQVDLPHIQGIFDRVVLIDDNPVQFEPIIEAGAPIEMFHMSRPGDFHAEVQIPESVRRVATFKEVVL